MTKWKCCTCGWIYDPAQNNPEIEIGQGLVFEDLPDSWVCPICGCGKEVFELLVSAPRSNFEHDKLRPGGSQAATACRGHKHLQRAL